MMSKITQILCNIAAVQILEVKSAYPIVIIGFLTLFFIKTPFTGYFPLFSDFATSPFYHDFWTNRAIAQHLMCQFT